MKQDNSVSQAPFRPEKSISVDRMPSVDELLFKLPVSCRTNGLEVRIHARSPEIRFHSCNLSYAHRFFRRTVRTSAGSHWFGDAVAEDVPFNRFVAKLTLLTHDGHCPKAQFERADAQAHVRQGLIGLPSFKLFFSRIRLLYLFLRENHRSQQKARLFCRRSPDYMNRVKGKFNDSPPGWRTEDDSHSRICQKFKTVALAFSFGPWNNDFAGVDNGAERSCWNELHALLYRRPHIKVSGRK